MKVWVIHRWNEDIQAQTFVGVFANEEIVRNFILNWADYLIQDAKEYGKEEDVREAERKAAELKRYYKDYDFSKVKYLMFGKGFEVRRVELIE